MKVLSGVACFCRGKLLVSGGYIIPGMKSFILGCSFCNQSYVTVEKLQKSCMTTVNLLQGTAILKYLIFVLLMVVPFYHDKFTIKLTIFCWNMSLFTLFISNGHPNFSRQNLKIYQTSNINEKKMNFTSLHRPLKGSRIQFLPNGASVPNGNPRGGWGWGGWNPTEGLCGKLRIFGPFPGSENSEWFPTVGAGRIPGWTKGSVVYQRKLTHS